jgi:predicted amino acid racemase
LVGNEQETIVRSGINSRKLLKVVCKDKEFAEQLIDKMKKEGIESLNGMKPEEIVVFAGQGTSAGSAYETYLKPAGY